MEEVKVCSRCKRELPKSEFYSSSNAKDGLQGICIQCKKEYAKEYNKNKKSKVCSEPHLIPCFSNPDLARFSPRELMLELKMRGFKWEYMVEPQRRIMYDKLK